MATWMPSSPQSLLVRVSFGNPVPQAKEEIWSNKGLQTGVDTI